MFRCVYYLPEVCVCVWPYSGLEVTLFRWGWSCAYCTTPNRQYLVPWQGRLYSLVSPYPRTVP